MMQSVWIPLYLMLALVLGISDRSRSGSRPHLPDYEKIIYGGTIKYVTLKNFGQHDRNFSEMLKELWYTHTDAIPLVYTKHVAGKDGHEYPTSVPVSLGSLYNCELRLTGKQLDLLVFVTLTKEFYDEPFYVFSHIFYPVSKNKDFSDARNDHCQEKSRPLYILSSLSKMKSQYSCVRQVNSALQNKIEHLLHHSDILLRNSKSFSNDSSALSLTSLKIMTYNIWNFNPYSDTHLYLERIMTLLQLVKKADPDIICFQEVRFQNLLGGNNGPSQLDHLASSLTDYQYVYQPAQVQENTLKEGRTEEGLAIFSKFPIVYHDYLLLFRNKSNVADGHQRICLHAVVAVPHAGHVHIFNTHYSLSHEAREESSSQILKFMALYKGPAVLMGDLNAVPEEKAIQMLINNTDLIDSWMSFHPTMPGFTFSTLQSTLSKRIDYILIRKKTEVKIKSVNVLPDKTRSEAASDHRAVEATLTIDKCQ